MYRHLLLCLRRHPAPRGELPRVPTAAAAPPHRPLRPFQMRKNERPRLLLPLRHRLLLCSGPRRAGLALWRAALGALGGAQLTARRTAAVGAAQRGPQRRQRWRPYRHRHQSRSRRQSHRCRFLVLRSRRDQLRFDEWQPLSRRERQCPHSPVVWAALMAATRVAPVEALAERERQ